VWSRTERAVESRSIRLELQSAKMSAEESGGQAAILAEQKRIGQQPKEEA
jgi:hypothetical protein